MSWNSCSTKIQTFPGSDSGGEEGEAVYAYRVLSFSASTLEQDPHLDDTDSCKS